ncbi:MAG TPA: hypothetical protein VGC91_17645 [Pyrinomonadaceae bacterium]|jgi:hypothetical protein
METPPKKPDLQSEIAEAQLRKLELEISALETERRNKARSVEEQHQKLLLEISSLKRQNGLLSRATQFATVITILATLITMFATGFGLWTAYDKFVTDKKKDTDLRTKEVTEATNKQYRAELQQLLQYPIDDKQTIPAAVFLFRDIRAVVEAGYETKELDSRRNEVGFLLTQLIKSPEFDLSKTRNTEYDRKAMNYCGYYADYLIKTPGENMDLISKYKDRLETLQKTNPEYVKSMSFLPGNIFLEGQGMKNLSLKSQMISLFHGYKKHVELLSRSADQQPQDTDLKGKLNLAFCWFYGATNNQSFTKDIFHVDPNSQQEIWDQICK